MQYHSLFLPLTQLLRLLGPGWSPPLALIFMRKSTSFPFSPDLLDLSDLPDLSGLIQ
ncbi:hypothetical protein [Streptomyces sp. NPDC058295]|uniref:hypothetical protein n=1 Tax=Streptomyces sp. NPDC058295 TaxID=3346431 RepID=UPI0036F10560